MVFIKMFDVISSIHRQIILLSLHAREGRMFFVDQKKGSHRDVDYYDIDNIMRVIYT